MQYGVIPSGISSFRTLYWEKSDWLKSFDGLEFLQSELCSYILNFLYLFGTQTPYSLVHQPLTNSYILVFSGILPSSIILAAKSAKSVCSLGNITFLQ